MGHCFQLDPPCSLLGRVVSWGPGLLSCSPGLGEVGGPGPQAGGPSRHSSCPGRRGGLRPWKFLGPAVGLPGLETLSRDDSAPLHEDPGCPAVAAPALPPPPGTPPGLSGFLHPPGGSDRALSPVWLCGQGRASGQRSPTCAQLQGAAGKGLQSPVAPSRPRPGPLCCALPSAARTALGTVSSPQGEALLSTCVCLLCTCTHGAPRTPSFCTCPGRLPLRVLGWAGACHPDPPASFHSCPQHTVARTWSPPWNGPQLVSLHAHEFLEATISPLARNETTKSKLNGSDHMGFSQAMFSKPEARGWSGCWSVAAQAPAPPPRARVPPLGAPASPRGVRPRPSHLQALPIGVLAFLWGDGAKTTEPAPGWKETDVHHDSGLGQGARSPPGLQCPRVLCTRLQTGGAGLAGSPGTSVPGQLQTWAQ